MDREELRSTLAEMDAECRAKLHAALLVPDVAGTGEAEGSATPAAAEKAEEPAAEAKAAPEAETQAAPAAEPRLKLPFVLGEIFRCLDADEDGLIGKDEYLDCHEKIATILDESFGPKQRKQKMQWYKDAGAEGTPADGMFLSREKWEEAFLKAAREQADIPADEPGRLAEWLWDSYAEKLVGLFFPSENGVAAEEPAIPNLPAGPCPFLEPCTIALTDLAAQLAEVEAWGYTPLVLASHCTEVHTFFSYKYPDNLSFDTAKAFLGKKSDLRSMLCRAMDYLGNCAPVLVKTAGSAFDFNGFCCADFPAEVFHKGIWTPKVACEQDFLNEGAAAKMDLNPQMWKQFHLILTSDFGLQEAKDAKVFEKIPYSNRLAVLEVDPKSIAKG